jgi:1-acyl-sn-glycerol-3-phosphate acyltransferase
LNSTLNQLFTRPSKISGQNFVNMLRELIRELERLGIVRMEYGDFESLSRHRGTVFTANHPSALDAIALLNKIPHLTCLMRASLMLNPVLRGAARMIGCIPNDIGTSFIRQAEHKLRTGENLLIFPEGTRTAVGATVNPFKNGFALIAVRNQFPIHTVLIERKCPYLSKGVSVFAPTKLPITIRLKAGKIFYPAPNELPRQLTLRVQKYFQSALRTSGSGDAIYVEEAAAS